VLTDQAHSAHPWIAAAERIRMLSKKSWIQTDNAHVRVTLSVVPPWPYQPKHPTT